MYSRGGSAPLSPRPPSTFRASPSLENASLHGSPAMNGMVTPTKRDQGQGQGTFSVQFDARSGKRFLVLSNGDNKKKPTRGSEGYGRSDKDDMNVESIQQERYTREEVAAIGKGYEGTAKLVEENAFLVERVQRLAQEVGYMRAHAAIEDLCQLLRQWRMSPDESLERANTAQQIRSSFMHQRTVVVIQCGHVDAGATSMELLTSLYSTFVVESLAEPVFRRNGGSTVCATSKGIIVAHFRSESGALTACHAVYEMLRARRPSFSVIGVGVSSGEIFIIPRAQAFGPAVDAAFANAEASRALAASKDQYNAFVSADTRWRCESNAQGFQFSWADTGEGHHEKAILLGCQNPLLIADEIISQGIGLSTGEADWRQPAALRTLLEKVHRGIVGGGAVLEEFEASVEEKFGMKIAAIVAMRLTNGPPTTEKGKSGPLHGTALSAASEKPHADVTLSFLSRASQFRLVCEAAARHWNGRSSSAQSVALTDKLLFVFESVSDASCCAAEARYRAVQRGFDIAVGISASDIIFVDMPYGEAVMEACGIAQRVPDGHIGLGQASASMLPNLFPLELRATTNGYMDMAYTQERVADIVMAKEKSKSCGKKELMQPRSLW
eukprot:g2472.t1